MPELPEVETFKKYLDLTSLNQKIRDVECIDADIVLETEEEIFRNHLLGKKLTESKRLGKYLLAKIDLGSFLMFHFGMTGNFVYYSAEEEVPRFAKVIFHFQNGFSLAFINKRKLGKLRLEDSIESFLERKKLGPDALELSEKDFIRKMEKKKGRIKPVLMDQSFIAGIGNEYTDEICFQCGIYPGTKAEQLSSVQIVSIYTKMQHILRKAVKLEADYKRYPKDFFHHFRKEGTTCPRCEKGIVLKETIGGRSAYFCSECQKK